MAIASKLAIKSADWNPKQLTAKPDEVRKLLLGQLVGVATSIRYTPNPKDATDIMEGLAGRFRWTYAKGTNGEGDVIEAPVLWAPENISAPILDVLREAEKNGEVVKVEIAYDIYATRSSAALGYTWLVVPLFEPEPQANDPFSAIMARIAGPAATPALADQSQEPQGEGVGEVSENAERAQPVASKGRRN